MRGELPFDKASEFLLLVVTELDHGADVTGFISEQIKQLSQEDIDEFFIKLVDEIDRLESGVLKKDAQFAGINKFRRGLLELIQSHGPKVQDHIIKIANRLLNTAKTYQEEQMTQEVIECCNQALEWNPQDESLLALINCYLGTKHLLIEEARKIMPDEFVPLANLADLYMFTERHEEAEVIIEKLIAKQPDDPYMWGRLGTLYLREERYDDAVDILNKILTKTPDNPFFLNNLALVYFKTEKYDEAERELKKSVKILKSFTSLNNLAVVCWHNRNVGEALYYIQQAINNLPENDPRHLALQHNSHLFKGEIKGQPVLL